MRAVTTHKESDYSAVYETIKTGHWAFMLFLDRFLTYVEVGQDHECWDWRGKLFKNGYGSFTIRCKTFLSHRMAAYIQYGYDTREVMHKCDNRRCCNPAHLSYATHKENMQDMIVKGRRRSLCGEACVTSKLKSDDVLSIRELYHSGTKQREIAARYNISSKQVSVIVNKIQWGHL